MSAVAKTGEMRSLVQTTPSPKSLPGERIETMFFCPAKFSLAISTLPSKIM